MDGTQRLVRGREVAFRVARAAPEDRAGPPGAAGHEMALSAARARYLERELVRWRRAVLLDVGAVRVAVAANERSEPTALDHEHAPILLAARGARLPGIGEPCPTCGEKDGGVLVVKRGRFGPFVGCNRYPDCAYIKKDGPPPPDQLPFEVTCPRCGEGHLVARRARRTGSVFWGCSRYPKCDLTTSHEPLGPVHELDGGPVARRDDEIGLCLKCGATVPLLGGDVPAPGTSLAGGPPDPAALARPGGRGGRRAGGGPR